MRLRLTTRAIADLADIADYLHRHSPTAALNVRAAILDALQRLMDFPYSGRAQSVEGVRKLVVRKISLSRLLRRRSGCRRVIVLTIQHAAKERELDDT